MVTDLPAEQGDRAAVGIEGAVVYNRSIVAVAAELVMAVIEVLITEAQGRGHQRPHVDRCALAKQHPVGVDQKHLAVGIEVAVDRRGVFTDHSVQRYRVAAWLVKIDRVACANIKAVPVGDQLVTVLLHIQAVALLAETAGAADDIAAGGQVGGVQVGRGQADGDGQGGAGEGGG